MSISAQCTTDATGGDGVRAACDSEHQRVTAPAGYALAKETILGGLSSGNGSEQERRIGWTDAVDVLPGLPQPRTIRLQAHARSPKGHWSGCDLQVHSEYGPGIGAPNILAEGQPRGLPFLMLNPTGYCLAGSPLKPRNNFSYSASTSKGRLANAAGTHAAADSAAIALLFGSLIGTEV